MPAGLVRMTGAVLQFAELLLTDRGIEWLKQGGKRFESAGHRALGERQAVAFDLCSQTMGGTAIQEFVQKHLDPD